MTEEIDNEIGNLEQPSAVVDNQATVPLDSVPDPDASASAADGVQMIAPSPLGAIERSKSLINQATRKRNNLLSMLDVPVTLVMEVGRTPISVEQLMELVEGSIVDLRKVSVDSIEVRMNEQIIAQGEAIAMQQRYGIRITALEKMPSADEENSDAA